jgi:hypothetical protein
VNEAYNYENHIVKCGVAFKPTFGKLTSHETARHRLIFSSSPLTRSRLGERRASI